MDAVAIFEELTLHGMVTPCKLHQLLSNCKWLTSNVSRSKYTDDNEVTKLVESRELQGTCLCRTFSQKAHLDGVHTQLYMYTNIL